MKGIYIDLETAKKLHETRKSKDKDKVIEWVKNVSKK